MENKKSLLGGGIDKFFQNNQSVNTDSVPVKESSLENGDKLIELDVDVIVANEYQPRTVFEDEALLELSKSIQENGILQPLTVIINKEGKYELIAGERRLRASKLAGLEKVPVVLKANVSKENRSILAIIENLQREDLNCVELASSYKKAMADFSLNQEQLANKLGVPRANIANTIRLLSLPEKVLKLLEIGKLSLGHGKILAGVKNSELCIELAEKVIASDLSVSKLTSLIKKNEEPLKEEKVAKESTEETSPQFEEVIRNLTEKTGLHFELKGKSDSGKIVLNFSSKEELDNIIKTLLKE